MSHLEEDIAAILNRYSAENASNTPDFILATYLLDCLAAFNRAVNKREKWYGRDGALRLLPPTDDVSYAERMTVPIEHWDKLREYEEKRVREESVEEIRLGGENANVA